MKKYLVFILFIVFCLALVGGIYALNRPKLPSVKGFDVSSISVSKKTREQSSKLEKCSYTDHIEYFYYLRPSDEEKANNKFGMYVYAENRDFIRKADELVNSNGGDWGYVLIPFNVRDQDTAKWKSVFDLLSEKHLIPIIQLNDLNLDSYEEDTAQAAKFLDGFVWPVRQRYISVYNEPNDSAFWRDKPDPSMYAQVLDHTIDVFKLQNAEFYMLNGALNVSATTSEQYMDAFDYMYQMNEAVPGIFNKLDGWASHSYPQPNFAGNPYTKGRNGIRAYETELDYLQKSLKVSKELPVFITETGWAHAEGESDYKSMYLRVDEVANNFKIAFEEIWLPDDRVVAVIPFTIWYEPPFDHFAWLNSEKIPYKHFEEVKKLKKVKGTPESLEVGKMDVLNCEASQVE